MIYNKQCGSEESNRNKNQQEAQFRAEKERYTRLLWLSWVEWVIDGGIHDSNPWDLKETGKISVNNSPNRTYPTKLYQNI